MLFNIHTEEQVLNNLNLHQYYWLDYKGTSNYGFLH